ncbi:MAG: glycosyltransferase family A protein [Patescibacteria group bacterium]
MAVETSIIIRTRNESRNIEKVLHMLQQQTYQDFEIIIVDSGSTDDTLERAKKFDVKIFKILPEQFSYPYALNYGIERSSATKYICILSAHSIPISDRWLERGTGDFLMQKNIAGVYGNVRALPDGTLWDKLFYRNFFPLGQREQTIEQKTRMGILGFTNALIRKDLWQQRKINEAYGYGGEDGEWAAYWIARGYVIIKDSAFTVYHSHYLNLFDWYRQIKHWRGTGKPGTFVRQTYRKDGAHD